MIMANYRNLSEYCEKSSITIEELKDCITDAVLSLSTSAAHELTTNDIEVIAYPLQEFNDILRSIE